MWHEATRCSCTVRRRSGARGTAKLHSDRPPHPASNCILIRRWSAPEIKPWCRGTGRHVFRPLACFVYRLFAINKYHRNRPILVKALSDRAMTPDSEIIFEKMLDRLADKVRSSRHSDRAAIFEGFRRSLHVLGQKEGLSEAKIQRWMVRIHLALSSRLAPMDVPPA